MLLQTQPKVNIDSRKYQNGVVNNGHWTNKYKLTNSQTGTYTHMSIFRTKLSNKFTENK